MPENEEDKARIYQLRRETAFTELEAVEGEAPGESDSESLTGRFNDAVAALRETGGYVSDVAHIARVAHRSENAVLRRAAAVNLTDIAREGGPYSGTATNALAVLLEGGKAATHPGSAAPDRDEQVRMLAAVGLGDIGTHAPEGLEAFDCYMALSHAAKNDEAENVRMAAVLSLGRIGKSKLLTWGPDVMDSLRAASDGKFPKVEKILRQEYQEINRRYQELILRRMMGGGMSPPQV